MKYHIITFGCQMNKSDSERIAATLESGGYKKTSKIDKADLVVVNMCSVRQSAVDRVFGIAPKLKKLKDKKTIFNALLTGCVLKKDKKKLSKYFDYTLDIKNLSAIKDLFSQPQKLHSHIPVYGSKNKKDKKDMTIGKNMVIDEDRDKNRDKKTEGNYLKIKPKYSNNFSAYVPISNGCNNFCAYCVVPYVRGRETYRPTKEILCEVKNLIKRGCKEIWLLGQNVNKYKNNGVNFPKLLEMINDIPGDFWIRFTSPHPKDFSNDLIEVMANCQKITEYLNLPVQSGDNEILKKMNRNYTIEDYKKLVEKIRKKIPNITLSTDVIVGFPGETKKQFENTVKLFKEIKFDMAYIAKYSPRPGTAAAKLKDNVSAQEKKQREKILAEILEKTASQKNKKYLSEKLIALISEQKDKNLWQGKTREYKTVQVKSRKNLLGKLIKIKITETSAWGLKGRLIQEN